MLPFGCGYSSVKALVRLCCIVERTRTAIAAGSPSGKNYIGPPGPAGGDQDREIVSFDGRVLITRFTEKDAATRYGNMVYVRCAPRA
jgi:hypothetical protein